MGNLLQVGVNEWFSLILHEYSFHCQSCTIISDWSTAVWWFVTKGLLSYPRHGMNQIISQLDMLVKEATQEEQQRQTLKKTVTQLRSYLADIESQLEARSFCFQSNNY